MARNPLLLLHSCCTGENAAGPCSKRDRCRDYKPLHPDSPGYYITFWSRPRVTGDACEVFHGNEEVAQQ